MQNDEVVISLLYIEEQILALMSRDVLELHHKWQLTVDRILNVGIQLRGREGTLKWENECYMSYNLQGQWIELAPELLDQSGVVETRENNYRSFHFMAARRTRSNARTVIHVWDISPIPPTV